VDVLVVEGVGGLLAPVTPALTVRDLLRRLDALVIVVARAGLGTINHCALSVEACRHSGLRVAGVVMSDADATDPGLAHENATQVAAQCRVPVLGILPRLIDPGDVGALGDAVTANLELDPLLEELRQPDSSPSTTVTADRAHVWHPFTQTTEWLEEEPLSIRRGEGCWLIAENGDRYLDATGSLWANVHGHAHPELDRALHEQAGRIAHSTFLGQTHAPGAALAAELSAVAPAGLSRVFYSDAGAAAVEVALRIALLAQRHRGQAQRTRFVSLQDAYHGDTAGSVSIGRSAPFHDGLEPLLFDVSRVAPPHLAGERDSLRRARQVLTAHADTVAALFIEPRMQGAAGMWPHSDTWLRDITELARATGALIVCDEVATGFGRTGDLFASAGAAVAPDILVLGKGLAAGYLPISATLVRDEIFDLFTAPYSENRTLYYGHTFSGNPLACAVARASLRLFETEQTLTSARRLAARMAARLREVEALAGVREVRQRGVMVGIELCDADGGELPAARRTGRRVTLEARRRGVVVRPLGDVVVLNPPLVMSDPEADLMVEAVAESIAATIPALARARP
jgi:adenosylmethionine-8-amino-7-oxononanoate aminotransferase